MNDNVQETFRDLGLIEPILTALDNIGYETPSPVQKATIPFVLKGQDILAQAQTGTGKTAAFALPLLSRLDLKDLSIQVLVLAPTRELAIQVAESFQKYASHLEGFHVMPIYGGQNYKTQFQQLKRGVHVVVGTPGRIIDHMRRGSLDFSALSCLVLDEADEMLRMGFIDDVEWILDQIPVENHQTLLFSATMSPPIRKIAQRYLKDPEEVTIKVKTTTAETVTQRYWLVDGMHKIDALTRMLEIETFDGMIIFVRTKTETLELAERLHARGYAAEALNGDIPQAKRERIIELLKKSKIDILVATDVVARGLDVERITHVVNYDIPYDTESYVHRIGRTGRAGRTGDAILFVEPRERQLLRAIERATKQKIKMMELPSIELINHKRIVRFKQNISKILETEDLNFFYQLIEQYHQEYGVSPLEIAAALAKLWQGDKPLLLKEEKKLKVQQRKEKVVDRDRNADRGRKKRKPDASMARFRIEIGHAHGVKPSNIVGAIANEAGIDSNNIGQIEIHDDYSTVDLPKDMPSQTLQALKKTWVFGQQLKISKLQERSRKKRSEAALA